MDLRFYYWVFLGIVSQESPYRDYVAIVASVLYVYGCIFKRDVSGLVFGLNNMGIGLLLFTNFDYSVFLIGIWVILVSINYLIVKYLWGGVSY